MSLSETATQAPQSANVLLEVNDFVLRSLRLMVM